MSALILVRHGQASFFASDYDELSELGRTQANRLGDYWARHGLDFDAVYTGPRVRQRQTATLAGDAYRGAGRDWPEPVVLEELDEYDLTGLLERLAPALARRDLAFAEAVERWRGSTTDPDRERTFQKMFERLTLHWLTTLDLDLDIAIEGWPAFRARVDRGMRRLLEPHEPRRRIAAFTSGGFIGTAVQSALEAPDRAALELSWRVRNAALTGFVFTRGRATLDTFNALPHLDDPALWTYR